MSKSLYLIIYKNEIIKQKRCFNDSLAEDMIPAYFWWHSWDTVLHDRWLICQISNDSREIICAASEIGPSFSSFYYGTCLLMKINTISCFRFERTDSIFVTIISYNAAILFQDSKSDAYNIKCEARMYTKSTSGPSGRRK